MSTTDLFKAKGISKYIDLPNQRITILDKINFNIKQGEKLALKGASGAGKSTLLSILTGIELPSSGDLLFEGKSLLSLSEELRSKYRLDNIGLVFQDFRLLNHLNVLENVMLALELRGNSISDSESAAKKALADVGLTSQLKMFPGTLSGGEKQRVAIARAFSTSPKVIVADEPTGQIDGKNTEQILKVLIELCDKNGITLIVATHDEQVVQACDRHFNIKSGKLIQEF